MELILGIIVEVIVGGSVEGANNEETEERDIAIILTNEMDDIKKERMLVWSSNMDLRYDRIFSIIDINKEKMEQWGNAGCGRRSISIVKNIQAGSCETDYEINYLGLG